MTPNDDCVRASTEDGPDYCAICSAAMGEWVPWEGHRDLVATVLALRHEVGRLSNALEELET